LIIHDSMLIYLCSYYIDNYNLLMIVIHFDSFMIVLLM